MGKEFFSYENDDDADTSANDDDDKKSYKNK